MSMNIRLKKALINGITAAIVIPSVTALWDLIFRAPLAAISNYLQIAAICLVAFSALSFWRDK